MTITQSDLPTMVAAAWLEKAAGVPASRRLPLVKDAPNGANDLIDVAKIGERGGWIVPNGVRMSSAGFPRFTVELTASCWAAPNYAAGGSKTPFNTVEQLVTKVWAYLVALRSGRDLVTVPRHGTYRLTSIHITGTENAVLNDPGGLARADLTLSFKLRPATPA